MYTDGVDRHVPLLERQLHFVCGKGGVGKSAVACALAAHFRAQGQRVLLAQVNSPDSHAHLMETDEVPNDIAVTLFGTKVPLAPSTVRKEGNVVLMLTERRGDTSVRKPISGTPFIEQNFDTARLFFQPDFPLPDLGTYALTVRRDVKDLTGLYDYRNNLNRLRRR